jgi:hypothetical protein
MKLLFDISRRNLELLSLFKYCAVRPYNVKVSKAKQSLQGCNGGAGEGLEQL